MKPISAYRYIDGYRVVFIEHVTPAYYEPFNEFMLPTDHLDPVSHGDEYMSNGGFYLSDMFAWNNPPGQDFYETCQALYSTFSACCTVLMVLNHSDPISKFPTHSTKALKLFLRDIETLDNQMTWPMFFEYKGKAEWLAEEAKAELAARAGVVMRESPNFGYVYLISSTDGHYKIGMSCDPKRRIKELKPPTILPIDFNLEHQIETNDMRKLESRLHEKYKAQKHKGEWYSLTADDVKAIKALTRVVV